jgi:rhomboid protease GluP
MDLDHILFLAATLNLIGDLYQILKFKGLLPRWILASNLLALSCCGLIKWLRVENAGFISIVILVAYVGVIKLFGRKGAPGPKAPSPATKILIATNIAMFLFQVSQNATEDPDRLIAVGALFSPLLQEGEWWRLVTAQFIHLGVAHLFFNMMGLWFLGPMVERLLGSFRFILGYLICGVGGMLVAWAVAEFSPTPTYIILMGASASVLGLVGLQAAFALQVFRATGSIGAKAQLSSMAQIIALQAVFDWMVPQVSSTAHVGGAVVGFILGMSALKPKMW